MEKFKNIKSIPAYLSLMNIDTDMIIPKQFLKTIKRTGLGKSLFYEMRYDEDGKKIENFILNNEPYSKSKILLAGKNFGCGSSREHAPIALSHSGVKAILALSFARIFYRNSVDGAFLLPIEIDQDAYDGISEGDEIDIDISTNEIKNLTKNQTYKMKPFSEIIGKIIAAGGLFKYKPDQD